MEQVCHDGPTITTMWALIITMWAFMQQWDGTIIWFEKVKSN
jgi:hypothetical protein